jgi:nucleotide-binding universal stress UspA family protein
VKVLVAADLTAASTAALKLVASLSWPAGSQIEVMHVLASHRPDLGTLISRPSGREKSAADRDVASLVAELEAQGMGRDQAVQGTTALGDPASQVIRRAAEIGADLVVLGSRGRGELASTVLGSVSAAVAERAPCSVLVARTGAVTRVLLADDESPAAGVAARVVRSWPLFGSVPILVASVADIPVATTPKPWGEVALFNRDDSYLHFAKERARTRTQQRVRSLLSVGRQVAGGRVAVGSAGSQLLTIARTFATDLIVLGASRKSPLSRFLLGSVTRSVLLGFRGSVLVVRAPPPSWMRCG